MVLGLTEKQVSIFDTSMFKPGMTIAIRDNVMEETYYATIEDVAEEFMIVRFFFAGAYDNHRIFPKDFIDKKYTFVDIVWRPEYKK